MDDVSDVRVRNNNDVTTALVTPNGSMDSMTAYAAAAEEAPPTTTSITARRRYRHYIQILVAVAVLVGLVSGSLYGFGRYSLALKEQLGVGQMEVQRFGIMLDTGNYIGHPLTGYIYDHYGPRVSCIGAAVVVFCGYSAVAAAVLLEGSMIGLCDIGFFSVGFGSGLGYVAGLGSITKAFLGKPTLGRAVAVVSAGYGLSSTLVGISFHNLSSLHGFFMFWAISVATVNIIGSFVFAKEEVEEQEIQQTVLEDYAASGNGNIFNNNNNNEVHGGDSLSVVDEDFREQQFMRHQSPIIDRDRPRPWDAISTRWLQLTYRPWAFSTHLRSWTTWQRLDFWILFGSFAFVTGSGLVVINNISTMVQSIGQPDSVAGNLVFLLSICNVAGRILMGSMTDLPNVNKIHLFQGIAVLMVAGLLISAASPFEEGDDRELICLTITVAAVAMAYGGSWVLIVGILTDLYGREDFGKDYGSIVMGPALSGLIFNSISALIYEEHAEANGDENGVCFGNSCYRGAYWMTATAAFAGCLILYQMPRMTPSAVTR
ncbi:hypothetical protein ACHAWF_010173 [Thalassiosira exigua]